MTLSSILNLPRVANNPISPTYLKDDISKTVGALVLMQTYSTLAIQQPDLHLNLVDKPEILIHLNTHQIRSKRNANYFLQSLAPLMISTLTDITGYAGMFQTFQETILELLPKITESEDARQQILLLLTQLEREAQTREKAAQQLTSKLRDFTAQVQDDNENFKADADEANQLMKTDKGELAKLQVEINKTQQEIRGKIGGVVISSLIIVGGAIIIGVGVLATLPANVTAASVIIGGISVVVAGSVALTTMATGLADANEKLRNLYQQTAELNTTVALISSVAGQLEVIFETTSYMMEANNALTNEWASIVAGIGNFKQEIIRASHMSDIPYIETSLKLAASEWDSVAKDAQQMMVRLVDLSPKQVEDVLAFAKKSA